MHPWVLPTQPGSGSATGSASRATRSVWVAVSGTGAAKTATMRVKRTATWKRILEVVRKISEENVLCEVVVVVVESRVCSCPIIDVRGTGVFI
jgi:hypothetical protein